MTIKSKIFPFPPFQIFFYSLSILTEAGFSTEQASWLSMLTGTFNLCGSLLAPLLVYRFRRRLLMLISLGVCALALFGMSFSLFFMMRSADRALPYVSIVIILIFILGFQLGLGPIPYFIGSGLYGGEGIISGVVFSHVYLLYLQSFSRMLRDLLLCLWAVYVRGLAISLSECAFLY